MDAIRELCAIGAIIAVKLRFVSSRDDEAGYVHCAVFVYEVVG